MGLSIEIQKKPKEAIENIQICNPKDVYNLKEVQEIKDAVQEHLLFVGLDMRNNLRNISLIGIGTSCGITIDSKYIIRTALVTASDKVILVHNHPANNLIPSTKDKYVSNITNKLLEVFNIQFLDHIIVSENNYVSMSHIGDINREYEDDKTKLMKQAFLFEENIMLKEEMENLISKLQENKREIEEEFECE